MKYTPLGHHRSVEEVRGHLQSIHPEFDCDPFLSGADGPLGQPFDLRGRRIGNRFAIQPMEGWDGTTEGLPTLHTLRRWGNFGRSGAKLIWGGEAFAVRQDGRANPRQLYLNPDEDVQSGLAKLLEALKQGHRDTGQETDDLYIGLQLTHSGRFARPMGKPAPRIACHHPVLARKYGLADEPPLLTDGELEAIGESYVNAAQLAHATGFDFVDVKCCHGYLMHELLGARTRPGPYGGSFANRTLLLRRIVAGIAGACPGLEIAVRVSIADTCPYRAQRDTGVGEPMLEEVSPNGFGISSDNPEEFDLSEPFELLQLLSDLDIVLVNLSLGSPYYNPHLQRPAAYPPSDGYLPPEDPLRSVVRHLQVTRQCKARFPGLAVVGTGYSYLQEFLANVAQYEVRQGHVDFVGLGRMILAYPEFPRDVLQGTLLLRKRICRTFSDCTTAPRNGLISGCYPLDPRYRELPEAARLMEIKRGEGE
jgi:2,4-dienoyl-CoA reductase-like NADH-dependent reductase (Old Yellow Enzyme family)